MARFLETLSLLQDTNEWANMIIDLSKIEVILIAERSAGGCEIVWRDPGATKTQNTLVIKEALDILAFKIWGSE